MNRKPITTSAKKMKRFAGGGDAEDEESYYKKRGLEESNKEAPVGFFERLRMGNIDDPSSEAYKRFGAGRGRASVAAPATAAPATAAPATAAPAARQNEAEDQIEALNKKKRWTDTEEAPAAKQTVNRSDSRDMEAGNSRGSRAATQGNAGRGGQGGPTAEELDAYRKREYTPPPMTPEMRKKAESQALEGVYPEQMLSPGLRAVATAAKALAGQGAKRGVATAAETAAASKPLALPAPTLRLPYDKAGAKAAERAARAKAGREEMLRERLRRYGITESTPPEVANALRQNFGRGENFTLPLKKGGAVKKYAKGGMIDGCAQRGKTKGRYL